MHPALHHTAHRPWPLPAGEWIWRQRWCDLLFAHWPVPAEALRSLVPAELSIDTFGGTSWVGIVPFRMAGVARRPLPDLPGVSAFPELNLRLYVSRDRRPGVWFLSLDATNPLAVWAARRLCHLPYHHAAIRMEIGAGGTPGVRFRAERLGGARGVRCAADYAPAGAAAAARPGTLEAFLAERYCLYTRDPAGAIFRSEVHHQPWPLAPATGWIDARALVAPHGIVLPRCEPLLHVAAGVDTVVWSPRRVA
jgi:uncharacterized protein YqjF (DUF2071 family)